jgi:hypothetical protein
MRQRTWLVVMALAVPLPAVAAPDVVGIKVGVASVSEVRDLLGQEARKLAVSEQRSDLHGRSKGPHLSGKDAKDDPVPDDQYVSSMRAVTGVFRDRAPDCNVTNIGLLEKGDCETITVDFSGPPGEGIVLAARRVVLFAKPPSVENTEHALVEKYGPPGYRPSPPSGPMLREYYWAWDTSGKPVPLNAEHPCAKPGASVLAINLHQREEDTRAALRAACAAMVYVTMTVDGGTVKYVRVQAIDKAQVFGMMQKTRDFLADMVVDEKRAKRDKAVEAGTPQF